jgi:methyl-accepting chemotaxis protein
MDYIRQIVPAAIRRRYAVKFGTVLVLVALSVGVAGAVATSQISDEMGQNVDEENNAAEGDRPRTEE